MDSIPILQPSFNTGSSSSDAYFSPQTTSWILFGLIIAVTVLFIIFLIIVIKPKSNNVIYASNSSQNGEFDYLTVNYQSNLNGGVIVGPASSSVPFFKNELKFTPTNRFDVHYDTFFTENVSMSKDVSVSGDMTVSGDSTLQGVKAQGIEVEGYSLLKGNTDVNQNFKVYGTSYFTNPTSIGSLTVRGNSVLQGNLGVTGTANFKDVNIQGVLSLQNASLLTLGVTGSTNLYGTLNVNGTSTLGTANIQNLEVTNTSTFNQDVTVKKGIDFMNVDNTYSGNAGSIYYQDNQMNIQGGTGGIALVNNIGGDIINFGPTSIDTSFPFNCGPVKTQSVYSEFITLGQSEQKYKMSANIGGSTDFTITSIPEIGPTGAVLMDFTKDAKTAYLLGGYTGGIGYGLYVGPTGARGQVYDTKYNPFPTNPTLSSVSVSGTGTFKNLIITDESNKIQSFGMNENIGYYPIPKPIFDSAGGRWYGKIYNYKFSGGVGTFYDYPINQWNVIVAGIKSNSTTDNQGTYFYVYPDSSGYWYFSIKHIGGTYIDSGTNFPAINFLAIPSGLSYGNTDTMIQS